MDIKLGKSYDFKTLAPTILYTDYKNQKVIGIFNSVEAIKYGDIQSTYSMVKKEIPSLPPIQDLTFILFEDIENGKTIMALEYIDPLTITLVETFDITITIPNANIEDFTTLSTYLKELGYTNFKIEKT